MSNAFANDMTAFDSFLTRFPSNSACAPSATSSWLESIEPIAAGISGLLTAYGGCSFRNGLYRLHAPSTAERWSKLVVEAFPACESRVYCFGYDWLGRQFVIDRNRIQDGQALVLLLDLGFNEALEVPANFSQFHNEELIEFADEALAESFYLKWLKYGGTAPEISQCVGYRIPPTLGGKDEVENLEVSDMEVYWGVIGQVSSRIGR